MCHLLNLIIHVSHMVPTFSENATLANYNELVISQYTCSINTETGKRGKVIISRRTLT